MSDTLHLDELPYSPDVCTVFDRVRDLPGACLLDSSFPHASSGRYDIVTAAGQSEGLPELPTGANEQQCRAYFEQLGEWHKDRFSSIQAVSPDLPFCGGLLGYLGYDAGNSLHQVADKTQAHAAFPAIQVSAYSWAIVQDHLLQKSVLVCQPYVTRETRQDLLRRLQSGRSRRTEAFQLLGGFQSNMDANDYRRAFERIQHYIAAGDCYQVNLAQKFSAQYEGDPWDAYRTLRAIAAAPFSAYLQPAPDQAVLCLSPERFLSLHGRRVETSPIKGTRPRYSDQRTDQLAAAELQASGKDRAENLMIVDLLRNDLGRSCIPGSIHVDRLFEVQSFPTVHHLVSTISGELGSDRDAATMLRDSFPGGSITGAPKRRAMEIIAELEPDPRQLYCGSLFYISADGRMDSNIAIRTLLCHEGEIHCWGGGGIVADSQWQQEYQETYDKVGKFLAALEATIAD
ncbi:MAG: aminodeoxychorismate synthase component I [Halieaceae bacterium]